MLLTLGGLTRLVNEFQVSVPISVFLSVVILSSHVWGRALSHQQPCQQHILFHHAT